MHADKEQITRLLKTARGQLDGILKMVEDDRYCVDISNQLLATESILHKVNKEIIHSHLTHCIKDSMKDQEKVDELMLLFDKINK